MATLQQGRKLGQVSGASTLLLHLGPCSGVALVGSCGLWMYMVFQCLWSCVCVLAYIRMSDACVSLHVAGIYVYQHLCYSWALASVTKVLASTPSCACVTHGLILCYLCLSVSLCTCVCVGGTGTPGQRYTQIHREVLPLIISYLKKKFDFKLFHRTTQGPRDK